MRLKYTDLLTYEIFKVSCRSTAVLLLLLLSACISAPRPTPISSALQYRPEPAEQLLNQHAPFFWIEEYQADFNRIGAVRASSPEQIFIDPEFPLLYAEKRQFSTSKGDYTNLIYRIHFQKIPSSLFPFYLGAGKNIGLLVVVTLDSNGQPLLYTTVQTCGCYLAFIPTSYLSHQARHNDWSDERQTVFGESLPALLNFAGAPADQLHTQIRIRPGTHRVMDVWLTTSVVSQPSVTIPLRPLDDLKHLPMGNNQTTSFYETSGYRAGHVKGSYKTRERLLMSWWAFDWNIGQDKYLGKNKEDGPLFYTSLKPWNREESDMRNFASFLRYWGWNF